MPLPCHGLLKYLKHLNHNCKPESLVRYPQNTNHIYHTHNMPHHNKTQNSHALRVYCVTGPPYRAFSLPSPPSESSHTYRVYSVIGPPTPGHQSTWSTL